MSVAAERVRECKVDGCTEPAVATRGMFALLCETHTEEKRNKGPAAATNGHPANAFDNLVLTIVLDFDERVETAIDIAKVEFAQLLRQRLGAQ